MPSLLLPARLLKGLTAPAARDVQAAWSIVREHLASIERRGGEPYAWHGVEVALAVGELSDDPTLLRVALLHDLSVHPKGNLLLKKLVSAEERHLIDGMQRLRRLHIDESTRDLDTVIDAVTEDDRLLLLRMAHRINDVRHLDRFTKTLRLQIARETLHMYTAIAGRIGFHRWRSEMEDTCFPLVHPRAATAMARQFKACVRLDEACLKHTQRFLRRHLRKAGIAASLNTRIKGHYSSYRKMMAKNKRFKELTDRLALRIIVESSEDCYRALGVVHGCMHPMPGKLKDYIGAPKENGYRSIHTVVFPLPGVTEQPIEIQIRTVEMDHECEYGSVSHTHYKAWAYVLTSNAGRVNLIRNLESLRAESRSTAEFEQALRSYFREDHIALFDANNNLTHLPKTATALDFVCAAFPERVKRLSEIRINGRPQSIDTPLHDGDTVDARFGRERTIQRDWLGACRLSQCKRIVREAAVREQATQR